MALRFDIRWTPMAKAPVTTAGRASGTAATARLTPHITISRIGRPRRMPRPATTTQTTMHDIPSHFPRCSSRFSSGVFSSVEA